MTLYLTSEPASFGGQANLPAQLNRMDFLRRRDYRENLRFYYGFQWPPQRINQKRGHKDKGRRNCMKA
jgi:hypothetical protein